MSSKRSEKDLRRILEEKENMLKENPDLSKTYNQFRQDWERYIKSPLVAKKSQKSRHSAIFGASLQE